MIKARYRIPLSALRKWEQGEASPAPYVIELLARTIPSIEQSLMRISGSDGAIYYYDKNRRMVLDVRGNAIKIQAKFNRDCKYDKEDIIWTRWE